jgi:hypothetical protein
VCIAHQALQQQSSHVSKECSETLDEKQCINEWDVNQINANGNVTQKK